MSQTETGRATAADERTKAARSFVRTVKAATRRKYTPEEKIRIVLEGFRRCWQPAKVGQKRAERSGAVLRCGELPEDLVVLSSPFDCLSLHLPSAL